MTVNYFEPFLKIIDKLHTTLSDVYFDECYLMQCKIFVSHNLDEAIRLKHYNVAIFEVNPGVHSAREKMPFG